MKKRYYLFTSEAHEKVRLDYAPQTIEKLLEMWQAGYTHKEMCRKLMLKDIELALIVMDLDYAGKLPARAGGFWGRKGA